MRVARVFLHLMQDAQRRAGIGFLGHDRQAQALASHGGFDPLRLRARTRVMGEGAVEERLGLRGHPVPIHRRADQDAVGRQEILAEQFAVAVGRGGTVAQVGQEALDVIVQE
ncbi:hypothetical protein G6F22_018895 [Rhizopus arrhizus]|nr:hypothetical protein G6F22_018895 [Rhizopus arrhizus]